MKEDTKQTASWLSFVLAARHDPAARILNVDLLAALIAIFLPWSTTGVLIFAVLWAVALMWTFDPGAFLRSLRNPVSTTPVILLVLAFAGALWSEAPWDARYQAVGQALKLTFLPLLLYHFSRTTRGSWVLIAFVASSSLLMLASWIVSFAPTLTLKWYMEPGVVVKNHIDQSHVFALCVLGLAWPITVLLQRRKFLEAGLLIIVALGFIANMAFVNLSRTVLVTLPVIVAIIVLHRMSWRAVFVALGLLALLGGLSWTISPALRAKTASLLPPYRLYEPENTPTSIEIRSEYWRKSLAFIGEAPLIGHGTGSIQKLFERAAVNQTGVAAEVTGNPHNQTLHAGIQWGLVGVLALYAMWLSHLMLFRGGGWASWAGFLIVIQNVVSSLFNSHLADFQEGWIYVLGVGVTGGMVLRAKPRSDSSPPRP